MTKEQAKAHFVAKALSMLDTPEIRKEAEEKFEQEWAKNNPTALEKAALNEPNMTQQRRNELIRTAEALGEDYDADEPDQYQYDNSDAYEDYKNEAVQGLQK